MLGGLTGDLSIIEKAEEEECIVERRADIFSACSFEPNRCIQTACFSVDIRGNKVICNVIRQCKATCTMACKDTTYGKQFESTRLQFAFLGRCLGRWQ